MSIFTLHSDVLRDYRDFVRSFFVVSDDRARAFIERALDEENRLWPDYLLQVSPSYERVESVDDLAARAVLAGETAEIFRNEEGKPFVLYRHQAEALQQRSSYVVTSGTGSGKSLTYFLPIVDSLIRQPPAADTVAALVVYPMNALVNSQLAALQKLKEQYERRRGRAFPVRFAKYTGETTEDMRRELREHPPHILLTNYVMAELLLVRPEDQRFLERTGGGLRYLVLDELHTYRGRQGADVAMLLRRLKERCASPSLIHVGTSATMVAGRGSSADERRRAVAAFASKVFGEAITASQVIEETLVPFTEGDLPSTEALRDALSGPVPADVEAFRRHPLARWAEREFGIEPEDGTRMRRRTPRTLRDAAAALSDVTGAPVDECAPALERVLTRGGRLTREDGGRVFAFKLHQFIGEGRAVVATIEPRDVREFSLEGQVQASRNRIWFPIKFCRQCGQDYYHVQRQDSGTFLPHPVGFDALEDDAKAGHLMLAPEQNDWSEAQVPDAWRDANGRIGRNWRPKVPQRVWVEADGASYAAVRAGAIAAWWQPGFSLCLNCGEYYDRERDFAKLASISSEARSSATTVLATSLLRSARRTSVARDKLLSFTDNRQDASLQAGHFNDFVQTALLRSALYAALTEEDVLRFDTVADRVVASSGLTVNDVARNARIRTSGLQHGGRWTAGPARGARIPATRNARRSPALSTRRGSDRVAPRGWLAAAAGSVVHEARTRPRVRRAPDAGQRFLPKVLQGSCGDPRLVRGAGAHRAGRQTGRTGKTRTALSVGALRHAERAGTRTPPAVPRLLSRRWNSASTSPISTSSRTPRTCCW